MCRDNLIFRIEADDMEFFFRTIRNEPLKMPLAERNRVTAIGNFGWLFLRRRSSPRRVYQAQSRP